MNMKLHDGVIRTFSNVRFLPSVVVNMISMGEITSQGYKFVNILTVVLFLPHFSCNIYFQT